MRTASLVLVLYALSASFSQTVATGSSAAQPLSVESDIEDKRHLVQVDHFNVKPGLDLLQEKEIACQARLKPRG
jgi:hypothetical protein